MSTLTTTVTAPLNEFITIVQELGYQEYVGTIDAQTGQPATIPNPETQVVFLTKYVKKLIVDDFTKVKIRAVDNAIRDERIAEKEALKTAIADAITATFTA